MTIKIASTDLPSNPETKVPALPAISDDPKNLAQAVRALKELVEVREGQRGSTLDQNVTVRDLFEAGVVNLNFGGTDVSRDPTGIIRPPVIPPRTNTPPKPTGFVVTGGFAMIFLTWNSATAMYANHAYTEIWRNTVDNFGTATLIGQSPTDFFTDPVGNALQYYYWIRFVSDADIRGPINATAGTPGTTATDPGYMLGLLTGQIRETHLFSSLNSRINLIDGPDTLSGSVAARIATESTARANGDSANASSITQINARINNASGTGVTIEQAFTAQASKNAGYDGQYTIKIDINGKVAGFGLANTSSDGVNATSIFSVVADKFSISAPGSATNKFPFIVSGGVVFMDVAMIQDATITSAKIGSIVADKITAGTINAALTLNAATINGGALNINNHFIVQTNGNTIVDAQFFQIRNQTSTGVVINPFFVEGAAVYIDTAYIKNLSASKIVSGAASLFGGKVDRLSVHGGTNDIGQAAFCLVNGDTNNNTSGLNGFAVWLFDRANHTPIDASPTYIPYRLAQGKYIFNTWDGTNASSATARADMASLLNSLTTGYVVCIGTSFNGQTDATLLAALKRCGATTAAQMDSSNVSPSGFQFYQLAYALIGIPGRGEGTGFECRAAHGATAEVEVLWTDTAINGGNSSVGDMTMIQGGKIITGSITAQSIAAGTITGDRIAATTITANKLSVTSLDAITANLGHVTAGVLTASKFNVDFTCYDPAAGENYPLPTTASGGWSLGTTTGNLGSTITTNGGLRFYGPRSGLTNGSGLDHRVKTGGVPFLVSFMGTVDHWVSLWCRTNGGAWTFLTVAQEPQSGYGFVGFSYLVSIPLGIDDYVDFGVGCVDSTGSPLSSGATEIRYGYLSAVAFNI